VAERRRRRRHGAALDDLKHLGVDCLRDIIISHSIELLLHHLDAHANAGYLVLRRHGVLAKRRGSRRERYGHRTARTRAFGRLYQTSASGLVFEQHKVHLGSVARAAKVDDTARKVAVKAVEQQTSEHDAAEEGNY